MTCFTLHTLRIFNILYWSLPNNLYGSLTFFTPVDRAPLWNVLRYKNASLCYFFWRRLRYQCFTHLFNQTVEREDDHSLLAELLAVAWPGPPSRKSISGFPHKVPGSLCFPAISINSSVLLKVWKCRNQHNRRSIFWSFFAVWTLLRLRKIQCTIASHPTVSLRSFMSLETSIWRSDRDNKIR